MSAQKIIASLLLLIYSNTVLPCSTFFINYNGKMVFGRNYDWMSDSGMVCTNLRGLSKTSVPTNNGKTISWISKYGSITFNQYGKEFPTGGMNETGLVVELMWLDGTVYPKPDERPAIGVLQWIQYQLDNHSTIEEVIASDKQVRIAAGDVPLHYLIADANGHTASIEFLNGKMEVHTGQSMPQPALTNDTYSTSLSSYSSGAAKGNNSLERFSTVCTMIQDYKVKPGNTSIIDYSFTILNKVAQGDYTKWSIVYDISNKSVFFKTQQFQQLRSFSFADFDFSCNTNPKMLDMNRPEKGAIHSLFTNFSNDKNRLVFENTLQQSSSQIVLTKEQSEAVLTYPATISCK
ncbi:linear amide C-N hydrolase [Terrimonas alba]|uniref:linear amide C-N hydrolase n=1 Tax=Terrimonas alba TaxID=3349636 RepID=UPI0035F27568